MTQSKLITVFASQNNVLIAMAKSLLEDAGIEYFVKGEDLHSLLNYGDVIGPTEIQVANEDAEDAKKILEELGK